MKTLSNLRNESRAAKKKKRVGRGAGSGMGKTCGRGHKGAGSRSGYERRHTYEGGQFRLFQSLPERGFSRARFQRRPHAINLGLLDRYFQDGDVVNEAALREKGLISGKCYGIKLLGKGELSTKLQSVEIDQLSASAQERLEALGVTISVRKR